MNEKSKKSLIDRENIILQCALLTTAALKQPFRARDVLFFIELIKHIFHNSISENFLKLQTIQVLRILDRLTEDKCAIKLSSSAKPSYRLVGRGCAQLLQGLADPGYLLNVGDALFIQSYLNSYSRILSKLFASLGPSVEPSLVKSGLSRNGLLIGQKALLDQQIAELEHRIHQNSKLTDFLGRALSQDQDTDAIIASLPSEYSYMASHQKPFKKFLEEMPEMLRRFEFEHGFSDRRETFYKPYLTYLRDTRRLYDVCLEMK